MQRVPATESGLKPKRTFFILLLLVGMSLSCDRPEVIHNFGDTSYPLLNEDSVSVDYPAEYRGEIQVVAFMFTHCPDICPAITANMRKIQNSLEDTTDIRFLEITFDPERDTPSVLKEYKETFGLDERFTLLTGDPASINPLLEEFDITAEKVRADSTPDGSAPGNYSMKHTNRILVMDREARVRFEYPGSYVRPDYVAEDIRKLQ